MKKRLPTAEEKKLWRESNRLTKVSSRQSSDISEDDLDQACADSRPHRDLQPPAVSVSANSGKSSAASPLVPLSTREANKRFKAYGAVEATLDLHGMTKFEAMEKLQQFIIRTQRAGKRHVAVITGKGRSGEMGVLRKNLPDWLNSAPLRPLISGFAEARPEKGGAGVTHVLLKKS